MAREEFIADPGRARQQNWIFLGTLTALLGSVGFLVATLTLWSDLGHSFDQSWRIGVWGALVGVALAVVLSLIRWRAAAMWSFTLTEEALHARGDRGKLTIRWEECRGWRPSMGGFTLVRHRADEQHFAMLGLGSRDIRRFREFLSQKLPRVTAELS
jgi:hypothetical protein